MVRKMVIPAKTRRANISQYRRHLLGPHQHSRRTRAATSWEMLGKFQSVKAGLPNGNSVAGNGIQYKTASINENGANTRPRPLPGQGLLIVDQNYRQRQDPSLRSAGAAESQPNME